MSQIKTKQEAWDFYSIWRKEGGTYCPALKKKVRVSLRGWNHITGNTGFKKRPWPDIYRRLRLLPEAKAIIQNSTTIQNVSYKHGCTYFALEAIRLVKEKRGKGYRKVRVIIIEDKKKNMIFLSVMDKK